jgi:hypothetical protein
LLFQVGIDIFRRKEIFPFKLHGCRRKHIARVVIGGIGNTIAM